MATKRASTESSSDELATGSDSVSQKEDNAKRARLDLPSEAMLGDLPVELLDYILRKVVIQEVRDAKLSKIAWKSKADAVMDRLGRVCPCWSRVLTTAYFRKGVYRVLAGTAQETNRVEILQQADLKIPLLDLTTLKDETFVLRPKDDDYNWFSVYVYHRNNFEDPTDVIPLPLGKPSSLAACSVSNCVYVLNKGKWCTVSVLRIARDDVKQSTKVHQFTISPLLSDLWLPNPTLLVTTSGTLILSKYWGTGRAVISIYGTNGSLEHEMSVPREISHIKRIIPKSNGNLFLVSHQNRQTEAKLTEVDMNGEIQRQYLPSSDCGKIHVCQADVHGRLLVIEKRSNTIVLLDSELNFLDFTGPSPRCYNPEFPFILRHNSDRNEIVIMYGLRSFYFKYPSVIRFTSE